ncbi:MAG: prephenate dehydrogenase/arogenate dehydrogenase family protein [Candidatus Omnitrophica bacterium]|nr:prephenate dehydrogenase/arogenate dehydrogenase family protein [Candidatus Omnitrophota bacterium]
MIVTLRPTLFRKVTIIGLGLIGGSLAKAIKDNRLAKEIVGLSQGQQTLTTALKEGIIDQGYHDISKAVANADLVVLATPVGAITGMLSSIGPHLRRGCIVTDVGSSKQLIVAAAQKYLPNNVYFVGSHPLAGSEKSGVANAHAELFKNATCIMTPTDETHRMARDRVKSLWAKVGAHVKFMSPEEHDKTLGYVSHLPHVVAYALMEAIPPEFLPFAAQGLKDTTRIAGSSSQMWTDIVMSNKKNLIKVIDEMVKNLSLIRKAISTDDQKTLLSVFKNAKTKHDSFS